MTLYAKTAGGNWSAAGTWSNVSALGVDSSGPPTAADDVIFSAGSGNVTIDSGAVCRSIDLTGQGLSNFTGTLTHNSAVTLTIGDGTAGLNNYALRFPSSGWTYTLGDARTSAISFISTSATVQTVDFNGKTSGDVTFNASSNGSWQYGGNHTIVGGIVTLTKGTLDINGKTCSWGGFSSSNSNVRTLTLGAASITLTQSSTSPLPWSTTTVTNFTFNANTSTISFSASNASLSSAALTFNNVSFTSTAAGVPVILNQSGATITFNNLTFNGGAVKSQGLGLNGNITVTGTLTFSGNSVTNRLFVKSQTIGTQRTITAAAVSLTNVDFRDILGAGAAASFTGTSLGDCGGNSGITTTTPVTRYWVGNGGNWSSTTHWSTSSGGASGASVPLVQDTVVFDSNSITSASQTISLDMPRYPSAGIDFTNVLNNPVFNPNLTSAGGGNEFYGSLTLKSGMTSSGTSTYSFVAYPASITITTNGVSLTNAYGFASVAGSTIITLADNFTTSAALTHSQGTLTAQGNVSCTTFTSSNSNTRTINMGSGTWTVTSTGTVWSMATVTNLTLNANTSTISITDTSSTDKTFAGGGKTYNNLTITGAGSGLVIFTGANTFNTFTVNAPKSIQFPASTTTTIASYVSNGSVGNLITITSSTGGTQATLSITGSSSASYCDVKDSNATGAGTPIFNNTGGVNSGNNVNWIFRIQTSTLTETASHTDTVLKTGGKVLTDTASFSDSFLRSIGKLLTETVNHTDSLIRSPGKVLTDTVNYIDSSRGFMPNGWMEFGNTTWQYDQDTATGNPVGSSDPNSVIYLGGDKIQARTVQATLLITQGPTNTDDRIGIAIVVDIADGHGFNLVVKDGTLQFLNDFIAFSGGIACSPAVGETWIFKASYDGSFHGKAWKQGDTEPASWQVNWSQTPLAAQKYSGIVGGRGSGGTGYNAVFSNFSVTNDLKMNISLSRAISDNASITDTLLRATGRILSDSITLTDSLLKQAGKVLTETTTATDSMIRSLGRSFTETVSHSDTLQRAIQITRTLTETVTYTDFFSRVVNHVLVLTETISLADRLLRKIQWFRGVSGNWFTRRSTDWFDD